MTTLRSCFCSKRDLFGQTKQFHEPWNYGARDARFFYVFAVFKTLRLTLKLSFSEDTMPVHAVAVFIEYATKMV